MSTSRVFTVGQVLTAAQLNDLPQGLLGKTTSTAQSATTSGTTELTLITAPAVTIAGATRRLKVTFHSRAILISTNGDQFVIRIKEGATILQEYTHTAVGTAYGIAFSAYVDTPTAASHTYSATIQRTSGTGSAIMDASASGPMVIAVEDIGQ